MLRVREEPDLVRTNKGTIQNDNVDEYRSYITRRQVALQTKERIERLETQNEELNDKLDAILELLRSK